MSDGTLLVLVIVCLLGVVFAGGVAFGRNWARWTIVRLHREIDVLRAQRRHGGGQ